MRTSVTYLVTCRTRRDCTECTIKKPLSQSRDSLRSADAFPVVGNASALRRLVSGQIYQSRNTNSKRTENSYSSLVNYKGFSLAPRLLWQNDKKCSFIVMWLHNFLAKNSYDAIFQKVPESSRTRQNRINSEHVYNNVI